MQDRVSGPEQALETQTSTETADSDAGPSERAKGLSNDLGPVSLSALKRLQDARKFKKAWGKFNQI